MLKSVAICSNLLVLILLGVWVVGGIESDVNYSHIGFVYCRTTFEKDLHLISILWLSPKC